MQHCSKRDDIVARLQERRQRKQRNFVPGSRIVWFDNKHLEQFGTILWIGELTGHTGVYAGVNFDNPVGGGANGRFGGRQLFRTKPNHAAFVQTHGLFAEEDYRDLATPDVSMAKAIADEADQEVRIGMKRKDLAVGDRIVWLDLKATPQFGTIRWIGHLEEHEHLFAGIDFDKPFIYLSPSTRYAEFKRMFNGTRDRSGILRVDHIVHVEDYHSERSRLIASAQDRQIESDEVSPRMEKFIGKETKHSEKASKQSPLTVTITSTERDDPIVVGERVVYTNTGLINPVQYGVLKWIGTLDDYSTEIFAGVEFDNPIGCGTGQHKGRQLFTAKAHHPLFVPYARIAREADHLYLDSQSSSKTSNSYEWRPESGLLMIAPLKEFATAEQELSEAAASQSTEWANSLRGPVTYNFSTNPKLQFDAKEQPNASSNQLPDRSFSSPKEPLPMRSSQLSELQVQEWLTKWLKNRLQEQDRTQSKSSASDPSTMEEKSSGSLESVTVTNDRERSQHTEIDRQLPLSGTEMSQASDPIRVGERIEWVNSKAQSNFGVVKWIGRLSGHYHVYGGIEFDNPIGGGTGVHRDQQIFVAKNKHALFVAYDQLKREKKVDSSHEIQTQASATSIESKFEIVAQAPLQRSVRSHPIAIAREMPAKYIDCHSSYVAWRLDGDSSTPSLFYLQFCRFFDLLQQLNAAIKRPTVVMDQPTVGSLCIAQFRCDWYRAEVTAVDTDGDAVTVMYIDYGNKEVKKLNEVFHITDEQPEIVRTMHKMAVPCKLDNVEPERSATMIEEFQVAFPEAECVKVNFKSVESGVHLVDVTVNGLPLAEVLVGAKAAKGVDVTTDQLNMSMDEEFASQDLSESNDYFSDEQASLKQHNLTEKGDLALEDQGINDLKRNKSAVQDSDNMREMKMALKTAIYDALKTKQGLFNVEGTLILRFKKAAQSPIEREESNSDSEFVPVHVVPDTSDSDSQFSFVQPSFEPEESNSDSDLSVLNEMDDSDSESDLSVIDNEQ